MTSRRTRVLPKACLLYFSYGTPLLANLLIEAYSNSIIAKRMLRTFTALFLLLGVLPITAQTTYTGKLRQTQEGKGRVVIIQNEEIEQVVNNTHPVAQPPTSKPVQGAAASRHHAETTESTEAGTRHYVSRQRRKAMGYRICIFTGGNSRADKEKAIQMGQKCRNLFGELAAYPSFVSPRWVTHVGDFRTREDAQKYVTRIRKAHISYEVRIVKSEVNLPM